MSGSVVPLNLFVIFLVVTLAITWWASHHTRTAADFYAANRRLRGWQNGIAISGDYTSAATFLGVPGSIALAGFDGLLLFVGGLAALVLLMLVAAEPLRNAGRYTVADALVQRLRERPVRLASSVATISVCVVYLVGQMVGAGLLVVLLLNVHGRVLGLPADAAAIVGVGLVMVVYVTFGGMLGITWVQIVKAMLLLVGASVVAMLTLSRFGFSIPHLFDAAVGGSGHGPAYLAPGLRYKNPLDLVSLGLGLLLGGVGLPHIMMRLYTVPTARAVRSSMRWAIGISGTTFVLAIVMGFGAAALVGSKAVASANKAGNMAAPLLARTLGGGPETFGGDMLLGFIGVLAIATILGAVAGLTIAASSSFAHDLWASFLRRGRAGEDQEVRVARKAAFIVGMVAILLSVVFRGQNVAFLVTLAFAIAASANVPTLLLSLYWKRFNTGGAVAGILAGLGSCLLLVAVGPTVIGPTGVWLHATTPLFPLENPGVVSIPVGFLAAWLATLLTEERVPAGRTTFQQLRAQVLTGARPEELAPATRALDGGQRELAQPDPRALAGGDPG
ncbi:MAG TPA: cation acetate symporter [Actinomycetes bacterium]|jgi:cation/acetate symporter|nr:cation acetate symporter [Actinomycetes bacterium]